MSAKPTPPASIWQYRDTSRWDAEVFVYDSLDAFLARAKTRSGIHTIQACGTLFDVLLWDRGCDLTIVQFHAAVTNRDELMLPVFTGRRLMGDRVNAIFVSDPSMYLSPKLRLGWFAGSEGCPAPNIIGAILQDLLRAIASPRVAFVGFSLGGYAALHQSWHFPESLCVPANPQTDLALFNPNHLATYAKICFGVTGHDQVLERLRRHTEIDLRILYRTKVPNYVLYLQNATDRHLQLHQQPFFKALPPAERRRMQLVVGDWGDGHVGPSSSRMGKLIELLRRWQGGWDTLVQADLSWFGEAESEPDERESLAAHVVRERQRRAAEREAGTLTLPS